MIKRIDNGDNNWHIVDNTRNAAGQLNNALFADTSADEGAGTDNEISISSTGFSLLSGDGRTNNTGHGYVYMAFADTRDYAFWTDHSGNNNDFQHVNLEHSDVVLDRPTNNFATLNPLNNDSMTLSEGNLAGISPANAHNAVGSTFSVTGGKWYWEVMSDGTGSNYFFGMGRSSFQFISQYTNDAHNFSDLWAVATDGTKSNGSGETSYGSALASGDVLMLAFDLDNGKFYAGKNGTFYGSGDPAAGTNAAFTNVPTDEPMTAFYASSTSGLNHIFNFGQDSSFAGNVIAGGNSDANGNGDFKYAPPSGFLALCTDNLPDPGINPNADESPADYFNTVLYTGNQSVRTITGVGFQPDWIWAKRRSTTAESHILVDSVRGATITNKANSLNANGTNANGITGFDADGFDLGTSTEPNTNSATYVAWNWLAGGAASSNGNGTITSNVSASPRSGFSIVSYTGTGSNATVGHGLTAAPDFVWIKNRDASSNQYIYTTPGGAGKQLTFEDNGSGSASGFVTTSNKMTDVPSSTVLNLATSSAVNGNTNAMLAYCFHNVEGYSKVGTYEGNGNANGAFVHTGFRPAWVLFKRVDATSAWVILDNKRDVDNPVEHILFNTSAKELSPFDRCDFLSNGFKLRDTGSGVNNADTILYLAFAEQPFKYANAR